MEKIIYSEHLEFRLKIRNISKLIPKQIFQTSKEHYFDTFTKKNIAVKKIKYRKRVREVVVVYEKVGDQIILITIHPLKFLQKINRIESGRWQRI